MEMFFHTHLFPSTLFAPLSMRISCHLTSRTSLQKVKIHPFICLLDMIQKHFHVPPVGDRWKRFPDLSALVEFFVRDIQVQSSVGYIHFDPVTFFDQRENPTYR